MWQQTLITLRAKPRGFHLVTDELLAGLPELKACRVGLLICGCSIPRPR